MTHTEANTVKQVIREQVESDGLINQLVLRMDGEYHLRTYKIMKNGTKKLVAGEICTIEEGIRSMNLYAELTRQYNKYN